MKLNKRFNPLAGKFKLTLNTEIVIVFITKNNIIIIIIIVNVCLLSLILIVLFSLPLSSTLLIRFVQFPPNFCSIFLHLLRCTKRHQTLRNKLLSLFSSSSLSSSIDQHKRIENNYRLDFHQNTCNDIF